MVDVSKSAADDLLDIYWRHHAKRDMPSSLRGKQAGGEDLAQLANDACLAVEGLLEKMPAVCLSEKQSQKAEIRRQRVAQKKRQLWAEREDMLARVDRAMTELDGDEWYYFWGLHQIMDILPQTLEEK